MFELTTTTECELTSFTGRTQKSGKDDVPAVSFRLRITNAQNARLTGPKRPEQEYANGTE